MLQDSQEMETDENSFSCNENAIVQESKENRPSRKRKSSSSGILKDISNNQQASKRQRTITDYFNIAKKSDVEHILKEQCDSDAEVEEIFSQNAMIVKTEVNAIDNIDQLNDYLVMRVMDYLPKSSLLAMSLTSKRYNKILKENPNRFPIKLKLNFAKTRFPQFDRIYREAEVIQLKTFKKESLEKIIEIFDSIGAEINNIVFKSCIMSMKTLSDLLFRMPKLKTFCLENMVFLEPSEPSCEWPPFENLKVVEANGANIENIAVILQHATNIEEFIFSVPPRSLEEVFELMVNDVGLLDNDAYDVPTFDEQDEDDEDSVDENDEDDNNLDDIDSFHIISDDVHINRLTYDAVKEVIVRQKNLQKLEIVGGSFFENPLIFNEAIQLKKIVLFIPMGSPNQLNNMRDFILSQKQLETVVVNILSSHRHNGFFEALDHILRLTTLKNIRLVFYTQPQMIEHYINRIYVNRSVEDVYLGLQGILNEQHRIIETTSRIFPNIKSIHVNMDSDTTVAIPNDTFLSLNQLRSIMKITINDIRSSYVRNVALPTLKSFTAVGIKHSDITDWENFWSHNLQIENIRLQFKNNRGSTLMNCLSSAITILPLIRTIRICHEDILTLEQEQQLVELMTMRESMKLVTFCSYQVLKLDGNRYFWQNTEGDSLHPFPGRNQD